MWLWRIDAREDVLAFVDLVYPFMGERRTATIDALREFASEHPRRVPTHDERSERARQMWVTRRARYGPTGARA